MVKIGLHRTGLVEPRLRYDMLTVEVAQLAVVGTGDLFFVLWAFTGIEIVESAVGPAIDGAIQFPPCTLVA